MPVSEKWFKIFKIMAERLTTKEYEEVTDHIYKSHLIDNEYLDEDIMGMNSDIVNAKNEVNRERKGNMRSKIRLITIRGKKNVQIYLAVFIESEFGEVVVFDFKRPHRSGINTQSLVRLTFLLRATSKSELKKYKETA